MVSLEKDIEKAKELVSTRKVSKLEGDEFENYYVVTGQKDDYLVILPNYCTCTHFVMHCLKERGSVCKHILAAQLAGKGIRTIPSDDWLDLILRG